MPLTPSSRLRRSLLLAALLGCACGPAIDVAETAGETEAATTTGNDDASSTGEPIPDPSSTTGAPEPTSSPGSTTGFDPTAGDETGTTGEPAPACPEDNWPDDGSEIEVQVGVSSVDAWTFNGDSAVYSSFYIEESAITGEMALGIRSDTAGAGASGVALTTMSAEAFRGQRLRLRSLVARSGVEQSANLWVRVDDSEGGFFVLDNGTDRPGYGTSEDWESEESVVDVPDDAESIVFGMLLIGPGTFVVNDVSLDVVSSEVPTTAPSLRRPREALECLGPTDEFVVERVHVTRTDSWGPAEGGAQADPVRDLEERYNGVPSLRLDGALAGRYGGFFGVQGLEGRRLRLTIPIKVSDFDGTARLGLSAAEDPTMGHHSDLLPLTGDWQLFTVVSEAPEGWGLGLSMGIELTGSGTVRLGYGVVEEVTDEVPLSIPL